MSPLKPLIALAFALLLLAAPARSAPAVPDSPLKRAVLYFPNTRVYGKRPRGVRSLSVETTDQVKLAAWYLPARKAHYLILYFHGNGGNLSVLGDQFRAFAAAGFGVLAVDYRGFGKSQGTPSEAGLYLDGRAAYARARALGCRARRIIVYGHSLGGGVATYVASREPCAGLVLESTFTSIGDMARLRRGEGAAKLVNGFGNLKRMRDIRVPTLIIHGTADKTIPCSMAGQLAQASPDAELWLVPGAGHNDLRRVAGLRVYEARLRTFARRLGRGWAGQSRERRRRRLQ